MGLECGAKEKLANLDIGHGNKRPSSTGQSRVGEVRHDPTLGIL